MGEQSPGEDPHYIYGELIIDKGTENSVRKGYVTWSWNLIPIYKKTKQPDKPGCVLIPHLKKRCKVGCNVNSK